MPKGRQLGSEGVEGISMTPEDDALARRRFIEYVRLTRNKEPGSYNSIDVIKVLPLDGGSPLACGDTRFDHLQLEKCTGQRRVERCNREMRYSPFGGLCVLKLGHNGSCKSNRAKENQYAGHNARRKKYRR